MYRIIFPLVLALCMAACTAIPQTTPSVPIRSTPAATYTPELSSTLLPTQISTATATLTPSYTPTPSFTASMTKTLFPTITLTWTPVPMLSQEEKKMNLLELLSPNSDCKFPCWWGVRPGASIQEALSLSSILGKNPSIYGSGTVKQYSYTLSLDELNLADFDTVFYEKEGTIQSIKVSLQEPVRLTDYIDAFNETLSLNSVLSRYGKPTGILLRVSPRVERDAPIGYTLSLVYGTEGFGIEYDGVVDSEEPLQICSIKLNDYHLTSINLYLQDSQAINLYRSELDRQGFKPLESVTPMSVDDFYQAFSLSENNNCIESSIDIWK
jgi:hypothetical protein